jgi:hypothetical protein
MILTRKPTVIEKLVNLFEKLVLPMLPIIIMISLLTPSPLVGERRAIWA